MLPVVEAGKVIGYRVNGLFREYIMSRPVEETLFFPVEVSALEKQGQGRLATAHRWHRTAPSHREHLGKRSGFVREFGLLTATVADGVSIVFAILLRVGQDEGASGAGSRECKPSI